MESYSSVIGDCALQIPFVAITFFINASFFARNELFCINPILLAYPSYSFLSCSVLVVLQPQLRLVVL